MSTHYNLDAFERTFSDAVVQEIAELQTEYPDKKSSLMMVMRVAEREFGHISAKDCAYIASFCGVSPAHVLGMLNFYFHFKRDFHGDHRIMLCSTYMCRMRGGKDVQDHLESRLGIHMGERTDDKRFSLEKVECLAACEHAPCVQVDQRTFHDVTPESMDKILAALEKNDEKSLGELEGTLEYEPVVL